MARRAECAGGLPQAGAVAAAELRGCGLPGMAGLTCMACVACAASTACAPRNARGSSTRGTQSAGVARGA
eukprot:9970898-Lingulodinium_polyedra.AAC.1